MEIPINWSSSKCIFIKIYIKENAGWTEIRLSGMLFCIYDEKKSKN